MLRSDIPVTSIKALQERYDGILFDAYGVLLQEHGAAPHAVDLIARLRSEHYPFAIVSNSASRSVENAARFYASHGLAIDPGCIVLSGASLRPYFEEHDLKGSRCVVLGGHDARHWVRTAGGVPIEAASHDSMDVLVVAEVEDGLTLAHLETVLSRVCSAIDEHRDIHLVAPNPDLYYPKGGAALGFAAGSIADCIERVLQARYGNEHAPRFVRLGKPNPPMFVEACKRLGSRRVVMVGDQIDTDIAGAQAAGLDSALVTFGLTAEARRNAQNDFCKPTYLLETFA